VARVRDAPTIKEQAIVAVRLRATIGVTMPAAVRQGNSTPKVETLTAKDIPSNLALSESAGWKDTEGDWQVVHECGMVLGFRGVDGLIGQGVLGLFETAGTIAKLVIAKDLQHQGLGKKLLDALLTAAKKKHISTLGLVTPNPGRPFYESRGFVPMGDIVVFMGNPHLPLGHGHFGALEDIDSAIELDARWLNCKRGTMLRARERQAVATSAVNGADGQLKGYAMATQFGSHALVGPVIADHLETAQTLITGLAQELDDAIRIDVPAEQVGFRHWLRSIGLREQGTRLEMGLGEPALPWRVEQRFALATQAWG
jgi:GNAT superfamily N-acetyltransferase